MRDGGVDGRLTIREAALSLGISEGAVRKRVDRGTLEHVRGQDGRIYVVLPDGVDTGETASNPHESNALISEMRDRIGFLEGELQRKDHLLAMALERIPAIEESSEPRESPLASEEGTGKDTVVPEQQEPSWWRRFFGLE